MKSLLLPLGALCLGLAPTAPAPAAAAPKQIDPTPELVDLCKRLIEARPEAQLGHCLSSFQAEGKAMGTHVCLFWERVGVLDDFGFETVG
jgi:hypothetical protein